MIGSIMDLSIRNHAKPTKNILSKNKPCQTKLFPFFDRVTNFGGHGNAIDVIDLDFIKHLT